MAVALQAANEQAGLLATQAIELTSRAKSAAAREAAIARCEAEVTVAQKWEEDAEQRLAATTEELNITRARADAAAWQESEVRGVMHTGCDLLDGALQRQREQLLEL